MVEIIYHGAVRLDIYFLKTIGFSPFSIYGATGQDNILKNNTINKALNAKDWLSATQNKECVWQVLRESADKEVVMSTLTQLTILFRRTLHNLLKTQQRQAKG